MKKRLTYIAALAMVAANLGCGSKEPSGTTPANPGATAGASAPSGEARSAMQTQQQADAATRAQHAQPPPR